MTFPPPEHVAGAQGAEKAWLARSGHRIWTSASLGQVAIESAFLRAQSGVNNFGGIKANKAEIAAGKFRKCPTHEVVNGETVSVLADFASYDTVEAFYEAHARVIATYSGYKVGWAAKTADEFLAGIAHPYATADKASYIAAVKGVMDHYGLRKFDLGEHELPAAAPKPPVIPEKHKPAVIAGGTVAAVEGAHVVLPYLGHVPLAMIAALALVASGVGLLVYLRSRKHAVARATAAATPAMTIEQVHAYVGLPAPVAPVEALPADPRPVPAPVTETPPVAAPAA